MRSDWQRRWRATAVVLDLTALVLVMGGAALFRFGLAHAVRYVSPEASALSAPWLLAVPIWLASLGLFGLYSPTRCASGVEEARRLITACIAAPGALVTMSVLFKGQPSRLWLSTSALAAIPALGLARRGLRSITARMRARGSWMSSAVIVGGFDAKVLVDTLDREPTWGVTAVATCGFSWGDLPRYEVDEMPRAIRETGASTSVVVAASFGREQLQTVVSLADDMDVSVMVVPGLDYSLLHNLQLVALGHEPALALERPSLRAHQRFVKRTVDVAVSAVGLVLLAPFFAAIAALVRMDSRGPAFYVQKRVGRGGRTFDVYKFRTMVHGAHEMRHDVEDLNTYEAGLFKIRDDPRLTRVGRRLRKLSIDELPQLWNVLRGEMSLVGPRPALPEEVEGYEGHILRRLGVRPGMTGLWQVSGRNDLTFEDYVRLDLTYVQNWSVLLDVYVLLRTVPVVLQADGAY